MPLKSDYQNSVNKILNIKEEWDNRVPQFRNKTIKMYCIPDNNFLTQNSNVSEIYADKQETGNSVDLAKVKNYMSFMSDLSSGADRDNLISSYVSEVIKPDFSKTNPESSEQHTKSEVTKPTVTDETTEPPDKDTITQPKFTAGEKIADTSGYNNSAAKGQCVWYVRGRMAQKLGKDTGAIGNADQMYHNAKPESKVSAKVENIKPDMIVSYETSGSGNKYGHVIYIEDVVGDTVYYTEGGSAYYNNGTDGVVKTATRQGILDGVNTNGGKMGVGVLGFIDLSKY